MCGSLSHGSHWELNLRLFGSQPTLNPLNYTSQGLATGVSAGQGKHSKMGCGDSCTTECTKKTTARYTSNR